MRERIIVATLNEVNLHGLKFTMSDLAKRLKISKRSLYEQFASKEDLIDATLSSVLSHLDKQEETILQSDLPIIDKLSAFINIVPKETEAFGNHIYEDLKTAYPQAWEKVDIARKIRMERITTILEAGIAQKIFHKVNIPILQEMIKVSLEAFTKYEFLNKNNTSYKNAVAEMTNILINGLKYK